MGTTGMGFARPFIPDTRHLFVRSFLHLSFHSFIHSCTQSFLECLPGIVQDTRDMEVNKTGLDESLGPENLEEQ